MSSKKRTSTTDQETITAISGGFQTIIDALVRDSLTRIEAERPQGNHNPGPAAFSRTAAAEYLGVSPSTIDRLRTQGRLKSFGEGQGRRFRKRTLDRYMEEEER